MRHHGQQLQRLRGGRPDRHASPGAGALSRRTEKVNDLIREVLADAVRLRVKDPRLTEAFFSFTQVDVAPDFSHARVDVSVMGDAEAKKSVMEGLQRSASFLQREVNREVHLRRVPALRFELDESIEYGDEMTQRLRNLARSEGRDF
ncbi:MAG: 30S ribosome-binding factor RbfA [Chloroflexi bacterium]|nr:30S ribosome-binding factor RbfA [Chloroflexota bacterium]MQC17205.1 30S ribosome-binding factor RbfA [Chloroflexota bacterium]